MYFALETGIIPLPSRAHNPVIGNNWVRSNLVCVFRAVPFWVAVRGTLVSVVSVKFLCRMERISFSRLFRESLRKGDTFRASEQSNSSAILLRLRGRHLVWDCVRVSGLEFRAAAGGFPFYLNAIYQAKNK